MRSEWVWEAPSENLQELSCSLELDKSIELLRADIEYEGIVRDVTTLRYVWCPGWLDIGCFGIAADISL
jgi:hypothetical protein